MRLMVTITVNRRDMSQVSVLLVSPTPLNVVVVKFESRYFFFLEFHNLISYYKILLSNQHIKYFAKLFPYVYVFFCYFKFVLLIFRYNTDYTILGSCVRQVRA